MKGLHSNLYRSYIAVSGILALMVLNPAATPAQTTPAGSPAAGTAGYTPNPRAVSLYNLGLTAHKQGSPESAIIFFKRACDLDPNLADARYNLGVLYQMQKRYKEAVPRFEEVLRIKPTDPDAHFQLGVILQETGRLQEARQHLSTIAPNSSHFPEAQRRLAQLNNMPATAVSADPSANQAAYQQPALAATQPLQPTQPAPTAPYQDNSGAGGLQQQPRETMSQPTGLQQQAVSQPPQTAMMQPALNGSPGFQSQPATAYVPPYQAPPPVSSGPVPVMANSTLRIIATGFSAPSGLAFDRNGSLYVANYMTNSIDRIGQDGSRNTFCTGVNLRGPIGLVIDDANNLYVANYNSGTVVKVSPAGISTIVASGFKKPYYLTLDKDGNLYVSQQEDNSIVRIVLPHTLGSRP
jgi:Tfp pilus assembly protein PilF